MHPAIWFERLREDLRHAWRALAKAPGFTAIAIVSIGCGTGANVAMFSLADALLLRPLPVPRPDELLVIGSRVDRGRVTSTVASYPDYVAQGMKPAWFGLPAGTVLSVLVARARPVILPMGERYDARLFMVIVPGLLAVVAQAAFVPARRASRPDGCRAVRVSVPVAWHPRGLSWIR